MPVTPLPDLIREFIKHGVAERRAEVVVGRLGYGVSIRQFRELYRPHLREVRANRATIVQRGYGPLAVDDRIFSDQFRGRVQFLGRDATTGAEGVYYRTVTFGERQSHQEIVADLVDGLTQESRPGSGALQIAERADGAPTGLVVAYEQPGEGSFVL